MKQSEIKNLIRYALSNQSHLKIVNDDYGVWWNDNNKAWESYDNTCDPLGAVLLTKQIIPVMSEMAPHGFGAYKSEVIARFFEKNYEYIIDFMQAFQFGLGFSVEKFKGTFDFLNKEVFSDGEELGYYFNRRIYEI